jgi:hypothetical protein
MAINPRTRGWLLANICMVLLGCATAPTKAPSVDVTGKWAGDWVGVGAVGSGGLAMTLQQAERNVIGDVAIGGGGTGFSGAVRGTVSGDLLSISYPGGGSAELTVKDNEMSGVSRFGNRWTLKRQ